MRNVVIAVEKEAVSVKHEGYKSSGCAMSNKRYNLPIKEHLPDIYYHVIAVCASKHVFVGLKVGNS